VKWLYCLIIKLLVVSADVAVAALRAHLDEAGRLLIGLHLR
jgi:hypothetical protein